MCSVSEGLLVRYGITVAVYCWVSGGSMQAAGQNALGRSHLQTSMFQTEQFYCMINFNWKHLVLSSWHSNHLYFIMYILRTKNRQPAGHLPWWMPWPCQRGREGGKREISAMAFANVIIEKYLNWFVHICILQAPAVYQHTKELANFSKFILCMSFQQNISIPVTTKPELMKAWFCTGRTYHQSFRVWNKKFDLYESTTRCLRCFLASQARIQF